MLNKNYVEKYGVSYSDVSFLFGSVYRPPLQRSSSAPAVPWHELNAFQPTSFSQSSDPSSQQNCSPNSALRLPRVPSAPAGLGQDVVDVQKNWTQKSEPLSKAISTESPAAAVHKSENIEIGSSGMNTNHPGESEVFNITEDDDDVDPEDDMNPVELNTFKKFARACDSVAPSMIEKFRASSGQSLDLHEMEELFEKASGTPQAPETPKQVGESQGIVSEVQNQLVFQVETMVSATINQSERVEDL